MKKSRIYSAVIITALTASLTGCYFSPFSDLDEDYFGKETFNETKHMCSMADLTAVQPVLDRIENAFSYVDKSGSCDCEEKFGALSYYCICQTSHPDAVRENHDVKFVTASAEGDTGYIWIKYDQEGLDKSENVCTASHGILSRIEIKKTDGIWTATDTNERP